MEVTLFSFEGAGKEVPWGPGQSPAKRVCLGEEEQGSGADGKCKLAGSEADFATTTARWSSGQDGGLSRRKREFDSPTGNHLLSLERESKQREL